MGTCRQQVIKWSHNARASKGPCIDPTTPSAGYGASPCCRTTRVYMLHHCFTDAAIDSFARHANDLRKRSRQLVYNSFNRHLRARTVDADGRLVTVVDRTATNGSTQYLLKHHRSVATQVLAALPPRLKFTNVSFDHIRYLFYDRPGQHIPTHTDIVR
jgi:hypothetical protein